MTNKEPFKSPKSHRFTSENASEYGRQGAMKRKEFYQIQKQIRCLANFLMLQKIDSKEDEKRILEAFPTIFKEDLNRQVLMIVKLIKKAIAGDTDAIMCVINILDD